MHALPDRGPQRRLIGTKAALALTVLGLAICFLLDTTVARYGLDHPVTEQDDMHSLFRVMGYAPTWLFVGTLLLLTRPVEPRFTMKNALWCFAPFFSSALSGGAAAVLKVVFRRMRGDEVDGAFYVMRPFTEGTFEGSGLSMPSEHVAVAFGALWMLCRMFPGGWPVFVTLGVGCAGSRLINADHYLSDTYVAAIVGFVVTWALVKRFKKRDAHTEVQGAGA